MSLLSVPFNYINFNPLLKDFLADYGLTWVGNSDEISDNDSEDNSADVASDAVWSQSHSLPTEPSIDFNLLVSRVNELNILSGEGVFKVEHTADGARLKVSHLISLWLIF